MNINSPEPGLERNRGLPAPHSDELTEFYWGGAARHELLAQRCRDCGRGLFPPSRNCPRCGGPVDFEKMSGQGELYSYAIVERPFNDAFVDRTPYFVALVSLREATDIRIFCNLVDIDAADIRIGMDVEVVFEDHPTFSLPQFRPATAAH